MVSITYNSTKQVYLASTFAVIFRLVYCLQELYLIRLFFLYLNNLFLILSTVQALLALNIGCTDTIRKNAEGVPSWLLELKKNNRNLV
jgi:hypothetical protein